MTNECRSEELSSKIRSVLLRKKENGQFVSAFAPYGYRKGEMDRHKLEIDEYAAGIVRRIFEMRESGMSYPKIAAVLNREGIPSPHHYRHQNGKKETPGPATIWTVTTVRHILHNEVYLGTLVMNYTGLRSYKDGTFMHKPETEWIRRENMHEPIIMRKQWESVQAVNEAAGRPGKRGESPPVDKIFFGKLICADCKMPLQAHVETRKRKRGPDKRYVSYVCGTYVQSGRSVCSWHRIYEMTLAQTVLAEIHARAQMVARDEAAVVEQLKQSAPYDGKRNLAAIYAWIALIRAYPDLQKLNRKVVDELIDHIEIGERTVVDGQRNQDIKVFYRFVGQLKDW